MAEWFQHVLVITLVLGAAVWLARRFWLSYRGAKEPGCACASKTCGPCVFKTFLARRKRPHPR